MKWYFAALKKFAECFEGRARRKEFWMFSLFYCIVGVALVVLDGIILVSLSVIFFGTYDTLMEVGVWGAMERKVRLATAVSGVSERPELAPSDRFRYGERVASQ